jgi:hypothetical protein
MLELTFLQWIKLHRSALFMSKVLTQSYEDCLTDITKAVFGFEQFKSGGTTSGRPVSLVCSDTEKVVEKYYKPVKSNFGQ